MSQHWLIPLNKRRKGGREAGNGANWNKREKFRRFDKIYVEIKKAQRTQNTNISSIFVWNSEWGFCYISPGNTKTLREKEVGYKWRKRGWEGGAGGRGSRYLFFSFLKSWKFRDSFVKLAFALMRFFANFLKIIFFRGLWKSFLSWISRLNF